MGQFSPLFYPSQWLVRAACFSPNVSAANMWRHIRCYSIMTTCISCMSYAETWGHELLHREISRSLVPTKQSDVWLMFIDIADAVVQLILKPVVFDLSEHPRSHAYNRVSAIAKKRLTIIRVDKYLPNANWSILESEKLSKYEWILSVFSYPSSTF